jgi:hypothetical protein
VVFKDANFFKVIIYLQIKFSKDKIKNKENKILIPFYSNKDSTITAAQLQYYSPFPHANK